MFKIFKFALSFSFSFIILSYPINDRPIFEHMSSVTAPYTQNVLSQINLFFGTTIQSSKKLGEQLFSNSVPTIKVEENKNYDIKGPLPQKINGNEEDSKELADYN